jgi:hypothetical protein
MIDTKDMGKYNSIVMLDYFKAFDSMDYEILLAKMSYYGFDLSLINWVTSYFDSRLSVTRLRSETSTPKIT